MQRTGKDAAVLRVGSEGTAVAIRAGRSPLYGFSAEELLPFTVY